MFKDKQELTTLTFGGPSFEDHGLELDMLSELTQYKRILVETTEELWRRNHPDKKNLPWHYRESLQIKFFELRRGSTAVPLFRAEALNSQSALFGFEDELNQAVCLVEEGIEAAASDKPLPETFPKNVLPLFKDLGNTLGEHDFIQAHSPKRAQPANFTAQARERLVALEDRTYEDLVNLVGEVRKADLDGLNFAIRLDDGSKIEGKFEPEHEHKIIEAFSEHVRCRLGVAGMGLFSRRDGNLKKIIRVDQVDVQPASGPTYDPQAKPVWELVMEMGARIPSEEWAKVPVDLSVNSDHYLYGTPKIK